MTAARPVGSRRTESADREPGDRVCDVTVKSALADSFSSISLRTAVTTRSGSRRVDALRSARAGGELVELRLIESVQARCRVRPTISASRGGSSLLLRRFSRRPRNAAFRHYLGRCEHRLRWRVGREVGELLARRPWHPRRLRLRSPFCAPRGGDRAAQGSVWSARFRSSPLRAGEARRDSWPDHAYDVLDAGTG